MSRYLKAYPFANRRFFRVLEVVERLSDLYLDNRPGSPADHLLSYLLREGWA